MIKTLKYLIIIINEILRFDSFKILDIDNSYISDYYDSLSDNIKDSILFKNSFNITFKNSYEFNYYYNNIQYNNITKITNNQSFSKTIYADTDSYTDILSTNELNSNLLENVYYSKTNNVIYEYPLFNLTSIFNIDIDYKIDINSILLTNNNFIKDNNLLNINKYNLTKFDNNKYYNKQGNCVFANNGVKTDKMMFELNSISLANYNNINLIIIKDVPGINVMFIKESKVIHIPLDNYIKKVNLNLPGSPGLGFDSTLYNFNKLLVFKSIINNKLVSILLAQSNNFIVLWKLNNSEENNSIVYIDYFTSISSKFYFSSNKIENLGICNNYLFICTSDTGLFILEYFNNGWKLIKTYNEICINIITNKRVVYVAIKDKGLFIYDTMNLSFYNPNKSNTKNNDFIYYSVFNASYIKQMDIMLYNSLNYDTSLLKSRSKYYVSILYNYENTHNNNSNDDMNKNLKKHNKDFYMEIDVTNEYLPKLLRVFVVKNKSSNFNSFILSNNDKIKNYIYFIDTISYNLYISSMYSLKLENELIFSYKYDSIFHSMIYDKKIRSFSLLSEEDNRYIVLSSNNNIILLSNITISNSVLKCNFFTSGEYSFLSIINYDCSDYLSDTNSNIYSYCSSLTNISVNISISKKMLPLWIALSIILGLTIILTILIFIYKYSHYISKFKLSNNKIQVSKSQVKLYNNPKFLGIELDDIKIENNLS